METARRSAAALHLTSHQVGGLGLGSLAVIFAGMLAAAIAFRGQGLETYSPFNHFISELGDGDASGLAWAFDLGLVVGGLGLGTFLMLVTRGLDGRYRSVMGAAAAVAGLSGVLVGVFPITYGTAHRVVSLVFFLSAWVVAATFALWLVRRARPGYPRWLAVPGFTVVAVSWVFIGVFSTYHPADPDAPILSRPDLWTVPLLEWAALLSLLLWIGCVALVMLRRTPGD